MVKLSESKLDELHLSAAERVQDVVRFDVAVDDSLGVDEIQTAEELSHVHLKRLQGEFLEVIVEVVVKVKVADKTQLVAQRVSQDLSYPFDVRSRREVFQNSDLSLDLLLPTYHEDLDRNLVLRWKVNPLQSHRCFAFQHDRRHLVVLLLSGQQTLAATEQTNSRSSRGKRTCLRLSSTCFSLFSSFLIFAGEVSDPPI